MWSLGVGGGGGTAGVDFSSWDAKEGGREGTDGLGGGEASHA